MGIGYNFARYDEIEIWSSSVWVKFASLDSKNFMPCLSTILLSKMQARNPFFLFFLSLLLRFNVVWVILSLFLFVCLFFHLIFRKKQCLPASCEWIPYLSSIGVLIMEYKIVCSQTIWTSRLVRAMISVNVSCLLRKPCCGAEFEVRNAYSYIQNLAS